MDDFNIVQKGSILPASALPGLGRREAEKRVALGGCPFRERQGGGCRPRGWRCGAWGPGWEGSLWWRGSDLCSWSSRGGGRCEGGTMS